MAEATLQVSGLATSHCIELPDSIFSMSSQGWFVPVRAATQAPWRREGAVVDLTSFDQLVSASTQLGQVRPSGCVSVIPVRHPLWTPAHKLSHGKRQNH